MAGSTINDCLNALDVRLPGSVAASVGVADLDTERYIFSTKITFSHLLHLLAHTHLNSENYNNRLFFKLQVFFYFIFYFYELYFPLCVIDKCMADFVYNS